MFILINKFKQIDPIKNLKIDQNNNTIKSKS